MKDSLAIQRNSRPEGITAFTKYDKGSMMQTYAQLRVLVGYAFIINGQQQILDQVHHQSVKFQLSK